MVTIFVPSVSEEVSETDGAAEAALGKGGGEGLFVDEIAASEIVEDGAGAEKRQPAGVKEPRRGRARWQEADEVVRGGKKGVEPVGGGKGYAEAVGLVHEFGMRGAGDACHLRAEGREQAREMAADVAVAEDRHGRTAEAPSVTGHGNPRPARVGIGAHVGGEGEESVAVGEHGGKGRLAHDGAVE